MPFQPTSSLDSLFTSFIFGSCSPSDLICPLTLTGNRYTLNICQST